MNSGGRMQVPDGWEKMRISQIANVKGGKRMPKGAPFSEKKTSYPYIRVSDFKNGTISKEDLKFVSSGDREQIKRYTISNDDLYISIAGTIGLVGTIPVTLDGAQLTENASKIVFKDKGNISKNYIKNILQSEWCQSQFSQEIGAGGGVPKLAIFRIENTYLLLPPLPEQKKIASILTSVDDVIEKTEAQINKLQDLKKGTMTELLTKGIGHTEFKESPVGMIPKSWDIKSMRSLASVKHGYAFEGEFFTSIPNDYILLTPGNFHRDGYLYFGAKTKYYIGEIPKGYILSDGDLLVVMTDLTKEMTILGNTIVLKSHEKILHNQRIGKVTILPLYVGKVDVNFLCLIMNSDYVKKWVKLTATGTTVRHTSPSHILDTNIPFPPIEEQIKISEILSLLEIKRNLLEQKLSQIKSLKKALMNDLLTGKKRVNVNN